MSEQNGWTSGQTEQPSYLTEMLQSQTNFYAFLGTVAASAVLAIPFGLSGAILPAIAFIAGEVIAATFIPASPTFRAKVDRTYRIRQRDQRMAQLRSEILRHCNDGHPNWRVLIKMQERIGAILTAVSHRETPIPTQDMARLEDSPVDFMGLWLARLSIASRQESVDENGLTRSIEQIDSQIAAGGGDQHSLLKARADLEELRLRHQRLTGRKAAVEAALLSLPDAVEEIYQAVIAVPALNEGGGRLQEAIDRLRLEEELCIGYEAELRDPARALASRAAVNVSR
ncbi:hypothetical protein HNQ59_000541 [Chitinivorax tropicus]|uniref:Uncharacterized protein n=1 Tax=Chitinivorax tropicus TaxID=714531 RepID=A0A840MKA9_9PROT|nr:hypothetical protein [Chitinivorax tropicus]MBB5017277.1 hypothetical protein [Chitinivorax tropicus]